MKFIYVEHVNLQSVIDDGLITDLILINIKGVVLINIREEFTMSSKDGVAIALPL